MGDPPDGGTTGVWYAAVWRDEGRPDSWVIRVSATTDVESSDREEAVCRTADEACALLREWLERIMQ